MGLISYCVSLALMAVGCFQGIKQAVRVIRGRLHTFECGHLVGEFFLQLPFCAGAILYLVAAHPNHISTIFTISLLVLTVLYLAAGMFFVTGETGDEDEPVINHPHAKLGWPLMTFHVGRFVIMFILLTISLL